MPTTLGYMGDRRYGCNLWNFRCVIVMMLLFHEDYMRKMNCHLGMESGVRFIDNYSLLSPKN